MLSVLDIVARPALNFRPMNLNKEVGVGADSVQVSLVPTGI